MHNVSTRYATSVSKTTILMTDNHTGIKLWLSDYFGIQKSRAFRVSALKRTSESPELKEPPTEEFYIC